MVLAEVYEQRQDRAHRCHQQPQHQTLGAQQLPQRRAVGQGDGDALRVAAEHVGRGRVAVHPAGQREGNATVFVQWNSHDRGSRNHAITISAVVPGHSERNRPRRTQRPGPFLAKHGLSLPPRTSRSAHPPGADSVNRPGIVVGDVPRRGWIGLRAATFGQRLLTLRGRQSAPYAVGFAGAQRPAAAGYENGAPRTINLAARSRCSRAGPRSLSG